MTVTSHNAADERTRRIPEWRLHDRLQRSLDEVPGLGIVDVAEIFGVSRDTISRWINGHNKPSRAALMVWAEITDVDLHWLETGEWAPRGSNPEPAVSQHCGPDLRVWVNPETVKPGLTPKFGSQDSGTRHLKAVS